MGVSVERHAQSDLVGSFDHIRPRPLKVMLDDTRFSLTVRDALLKHYGSVKAMAYALGRVDPSLMQREFEAGKLARVDTYTDASAKAAIATALAERYTELSTPKARARQRIREARAILDELDQVMELIA